MHWEVEQKFPVRDLAVVKASLIQLGARFSPSIAQADHYFNHPARDFAQTDEALRLRQAGDEYFITYKGPRTDATTKTRQELEIALPTGSEAVAQVSALSTALGFQPVATVRKARTPGILDWNGYEVVLALDSVEDVGTFLELEITSDDSGVAAAKSALETLASSLALGTSERRSYLELLISSH